MLEKNGRGTGSIGLKDFSLFGWTIFNSLISCLHWSVVQVYDVSQDGSYRNQDEYLSFCTGCVSQISGSFSQFSKASLFFTLTFSVILCQ